MACAAAGCSRREGNRPLHSLSPTVASFLSTWTALRRLKSVIILALKRAATRSRCAVFTANRSTATTLLPFSSPAHRHQPPPTLLTANQATAAQRLWHRWRRSSTRGARWRSRRTTPPAASPPSASREGTPTHALSRAALAGGRSQTPPARSVPSGGLTQLRFIVW